MHDRPDELLASGELWRVTLLVVVVAAAQIEEAAGQLLAHPLAVDGHGPAGLLARPVGRHDGVTEADAFIDAELRRRATDVVADLVAVGDRVTARPRFEGVAERRHVGVRANPGVPEQVPRAPDRIASLEHRVRRAGAHGL